MELYIRDWRKVYKMQGIRVMNKKIASHYLHNPNIKKATVDDLKDATAKIRQRIREIDKDIYEQQKKTQEKEGISLEEERFELSNINSVIYEELQDRKGIRMKTFAPALMGNEKG